MKQNQRVGFIYKNKCHPVTTAFAQAIDATPHKITGPINAIQIALKIPDYDYYFIESVMSMITPVTKRMLGKKCTIVFRGNDELFANTTAYTASSNPLKRWFLNYLIKNMDAISVESTMQVKEVQQHTAVPVEVNESFVAITKELQKLKVQTKENSFLFIGAYRPPFDHKNIEYLIDVFNKLPNYNLTIIGKNTKELQSRAKENITIHDYVEDITEFWEKSTFYIHLPKYEAGPITLLEAMIAGCIPITNNKAGHSNKIAAINKDLVLDANNTIEQTAKKIESIAQIKQKERNKLAETFKKTTKSLFREEKMCQAFQESWEKLTQNAKKR